MSRTLLVIHIALLVAFGLGALLRAQGRPEPAVWPIGSAPAYMAPAIAEADTMIVAQHSALLRQLARALSEGGVRLAIQVCHLEATEAAVWIGRRHGIATGRTSDRLRTLTNKPKPWASRIVATYLGQSAKDVPGFAVDLGDRVGVMRPIAMQPICESCHGAPDKIDPAATALLRERYPHDRAVGFKNGEIRGWYWVEMPKTASR